MAFITADTRSDIIEISVAMLNQAPSAALLEDLVALSISGGDLNAVAEHIATTEAFTSENPSFQTARQFATEIFDKITTGGVISSAARANVLDIATGYLNNGMSKAGLVVEIVNVLADPGTLGHPVYGDIAQSFQNRAAAAEYFVVDKELGDSTDAELAAAIATVTSDAATLAAANQEADSSANAEVLTSSVDVLTANKFASRPEYTPAGNDLVNTLQDEDELTGVGVNPTLNVTLGSVNDAAEGAINPILNGIETINVAITSGDVTLLGLEEATGTKAINVTRITANQSDLTVDNIAESVDTLTVTNATRGADIEFNFRDDAGMELEDSLAVGLDNVRLGNLDITRTGSAEDQQDTINLSTAGAVAEVANFATFSDDDATTEQTLNMMLGAITNDFDAVTSDVTEVNLTANGETVINALNTDSAESLNIEANATVEIDAQTTSSLAAITITGSADVDLSAVTGDAEGLAIDSTELAATGRLFADLSAVSASPLTSVRTGAGDDELESSANFAGEIAVGAGDNTVDTAADFAATASVSALDGDNAVVGGALKAIGDTIAGLENDNEVDSAASITLGDGDNSVEVSVMESAASWTDGDTEDFNEDDTFTRVGAQISAGDGDNTVALNSMQENAVIDLGDGANSVAFAIASEDGSTVMAGDSFTADTIEGEDDADRERVNIDSADAAEDELGAQVYLGDGGNTVTFEDVFETSSDDENGITYIDDQGIDSLLLGEGALLSAGSGADSLNVDFINDVQVVANATEEDDDALIQGVEVINLTAQKAGLAGEDAAQPENTLIQATASVSLDVQRVDTELDTINLVSLEDVSTVTTGLGDSEEFSYDVAGNATYFDLKNLREGIELNLQAHEATGISGEDDEPVTPTAQDDSLADVFLSANLVDASGTDDTFTLNIAGSNTFDLDLDLGASDLPLGEDRDGEDAYEVENVVINLNTASHTFFLNDFGNGFENDTTFTVTGTVADTEIVLNDLDANVITVEGDANVTLDITGYDAKQLQLTTGAGSDHVHVLGASMLVAGSSVDLGAGENTFGVVGLTGEDITDVEALESFADINVSGEMHRVEIFDDFLLEESATLDLSGFSTDVSELYIGDIDNSGGAETVTDLTIKGMSGDVQLESLDGLNLLNFYTGRLAVEDATSITVSAGMQHAMQEDGAGPYGENNPADEDSAEVDFNLSTVNAVLTKLEVAAENTIDVYISDNDDSVDFAIDEVLLTSFEDTDFEIDDNIGTKVTVDTVTLTSGDDIDFTMHNSTDAYYDFGEVNLTSTGDDIVVHYDESGVDGTGHVGSTLLIDTLSLNSDQYSEIEINVTTDSTVNIGDTSVIAGEYVEIYIGGDYLEDFNRNSEITFGDLTVQAGSDYYAQMYVDYNVSSTLTFGDISVSGGEDSSYVDVEVDDNVNTDITIASLDLDAEDSSNYLSVLGNRLVEREVINSPEFLGEDAELELFPEDETLEDVKITVTGDITLDSFDDADLDIDSNYDESVERDLIIDLQGGVSVTSTDRSASMSVDDNDGSTVNVEGQISVVSEDISSTATLDMYDNEDATIRFKDTVEVRGEYIDGEDEVSGEDSDAYLNIGDNYDSSVRIDGKVTVSSDDNSEAYLQNNDDGSIRLAAGLEVSSGNDSDVLIVDQDFGITAVNGITVEATNEDSASTLIVGGNDDSRVTTGNVAVSAERGLAGLLGEDNDDSMLTMGTVEMSGAETQFAYAGNDNSVSVIGNVTMESSFGEDSMGDDDADFYLSSTGGEDESIEVGTVTMKASDDVFFYADDSNVIGEDDYDVTIGNLDLRAGTAEQEVDGVSGWVDSPATESDVSLYANNIAGTETIRTQTNEESGSHMDVYADNTPDLYSVTMVGGEDAATSSLRVFGEQGSDEDGRFTIDLSDLVSSAEVYTVEDTDLEDSYATLDDVAVFTDTVELDVHIGASALVEYNVDTQASGALFTGSASGYTSMGARDLDPVEEVITIDGFEGTEGGVIGGEDQNYNSRDDISVTFEGGDSFVFTSTGGGAFSVTGPETTDFAEMATRIGAQSVAIVDNQLVITGAADGSDITPVTSALKSAVQYTYDWFEDERDTVTTVTNPSFRVSTEGEMVQDGLGLEEREVFTFTGEAIGEVVIGGFNPGQWNTVSPINSQVTDRLDFSQFDSVNSLDDMIISIDDSGPVSNVFIDFTDETLGDVTLVGVGDYDNAVQLVEGSVLFG